MGGFSALALKQRWQFANTMRLFRAQPLLKRIVVAVFALGLEGALFVLFRDGFAFLDSLGGVGTLIVGRLFSVFFLGMSAMLVASGIITSYMTLFRSDELPFLLTRPFRFSHVAVYKFLQSTVLSSWAFFFIIIPFVAAYGWRQQLSPLFALWTLAFSVPFLIVCSAIGSVAVMLFARWFPRVRVARKALALTALAGSALVWWFVHSVHRSSETTVFDFTRMVPGFRLASNALLPSFWYADGIMSLARGEWLRGAMFGLMLTATALLLLVVIEWIADRSYYATWMRVISGQERTLRAPVLFPGLDRLLTPAPTDVRALVMKDVRTFFRDPMQWSQTLIFFGLLAIYFANLRSFRYDALAVQWRNLIAFLNVFSVSAVLCSLGARFIYPQLSLEGQGFWVLGLSPTTMTRIVATKFVLSLIALLSVSVGLILLSGAMLRVSPAARTISVVLACAVTFAVCGLSSGLGAIFLDLRQSNPAAIVSGFGGTLNLVLSLGFLVGAIMPFGLIFHLQTNLALPPTTVTRALIAALVWLTALTVAATAIPLWMGVRSLQRRDF